MFAIPNQSKATSAFDDIISAIDNGAGATRSWAGASVTSTTAMQQATVYACIRILAETIATLPIKIQTKNAGGLWIDTPDHDSLAVLDHPNDFQSQHDLISLWVTWMELQGNAYSYKLYAGPPSNQRVHQLLPLQSPEVAAELTDGWKLRYDVSGIISGNDLTSKEIMHVRHFGMAGYIGLNPIQKLRHDIGLSLRGKEHASGVFAHGAIAGRVIEAESIKSAELAREMQAQFDREYAGAHRTGKTPVMWGGAKLTEMGMNSSDAQLLELLKLEKEEIASLFGVPGFLVNSAEKNTTWGSGLEEITKSFMRFSLRPRTNRICHTMKHNLLASNEKKRTRYVFETDAFTLGSFKDIIESANTAVASGILNPNEARELINLNPRDGGDVYRESPNSVPEGGDDDDNDDETADEPPPNDDETEENDDE
jgi:HK97 family phage portal protein